MNTIDATPDFSASDASHCSRRPTCSLTCSSVLIPGKLDSPRARDFAFECARESKLGRWNRCSLYCADCNMLGTLFASSETRMLFEARVALLLGSCGYECRNVSDQIDEHGVWVPAFAGTTCVTWIRGYIRSLLSSLRTQGPITTGCVIESSPVNPVRSASNPKSLGDRADVRIS